MPEGAPTQRPAGPGTAWPGVPRHGSRARLEAGRLHRPFRPKCEPQIPSRMPAKHRPKAREQGHHGQHNPLVLPCSLLALSQCWDHWSRLVPAAVSHVFLPWQPPHVPRRQSPGFLCQAERLALHLCPVQWRLVAFVPRQDQRQAKRRSLGTWGTVQVTPHRQRQQIQGQQPRALPPMQQPVLSPAGRIGWRPGPVVPRAIRRTPAWQGTHSAHTCADPGCAPDTASMRRCYLANHANHPCATLRQFVLVLPCVLS